MWEILTFARHQPYADLVDDKVIENVSHFYHNDGHQIYLPQPPGCPKEIYDLMKECWQRNEHDRPNFREIHLFLQRKNLGYAPNVQFVIELFCVGDNQVTGKLSSPPLDES
ncbi:discoidin domain-containing receptor 2 [Trichonephila clavipes]|uniref:Discoidin domain-containing receptor 2 n=1 Tax=Trichonephila clavipes TaxID=2585209 RepID=A0A8X7BCW7_TRICX|nr:discoidin domain-containing receptor 2 [Trichonephila clavipes]